ncbi:hypothetical protein IGI04_020160 [Brassica rapa subsp. trilocularis]|uniref:Subtilisin-like protease fibronectin type-III domain-containing protein n=1 Tax=Brassica rapa subsp. trilocularis TaxID=1813537 RepID=A0ABQ7MLB0_BRACM|nr:hypothetical protein IGI04_020160 [Brassica rapa subsp. trilocularis]
MFNLSSSWDAVPSTTGLRTGTAVESGTYMSCRHVAGASAYIKTFHPEWSPSMIQSVIMTTAWAMSMDQGEFAYGAGHVDPIKAVNPGLVYEVDKSDHINFLCGMNYILKMLQLISGEAVTCTGKTLPKNLNYPSMTARVAAGKQFQVNFSRTLRNLGMRSTYKAEVSGSKLDVRVIPEALSLNTMHEKESFELTVCLFQGMVLKTTLRTLFLYLIVSQIDRQFLLQHPETEQSLCLGDHLASHQLQEGSMAKSL